MTDKKITPFTFVSDICGAKRNIMVDPEVEKAYVPFVINRTLSYWQDCVHIANEMNVNHHLDSKLQYEFLLNMITRRKGFRRWHKKVDDEALQAVMKYYGYSTQVAEQALTILTDEQIEVIKTKVQQGGKNKK